MAFLLTRRSLLAAGSTAWAATRARAAARTVRWALLSDTHVPADSADAYRGFHPREFTRRAIAQVLESPVEGALINGDLARDHGTEEDYAALRQLTAPLVKRMPLSLSLGNHDHRDNFLAAFQSLPGDRAAVKGKCVTVLDAGTAQMVFLDSLFIFQHVPGLLGKAQRTWLEAWLRESPARPTLLFVHHTLGDDDNSLLDAERFLRIATRSPKVKAVFYGHSHRYSCDVVEGMHLVNIPAVGYNFSDDQPTGWLDTAFSAEGCELTLRATGGNTAENGKTRSLAWRG